MRAPVRDERGQVEQVDGGVAALRGHAVLQLAAPQAAPKLARRAARLLRLRTDAHPAKSAARSG